MAKDWNYAQMVKKAAESGGPELWLEAIKKAAYNRGASDMINVLAVPLIITGIGLGTAGVIGCQKIKKWYLDKKDEKLLAEKEAAQAEIFLKKELDDAIEELEVNTNTDCITEE